MLPMTPPAESGRSKTFDGGHIQRGGIPDTKFLVAFFLGTLCPPPSSPTLSPMRCANRCLSMP